MKRVLLILALISFSIASYGQTVLWADKVESYSSKFGEKQYAPEQALNKPNVLPNLGLSPNAWSPKRKNQKEHIKVSFAEQISIQQIAIAETNNPGGIKSIYAYDQYDIEHLVYEFEPKGIPIEGRLFRLFIDKTSYQVTALKIEIDGSTIGGYFGIDAIGISDSREPITVDINISDEIDSDYLPIALDSNVNTEYNELRPLISPDGKQLFFSRQNDPENTGGDEDDEDIWVSNRDSVTGNWGKAQNIGKPLNNDGPNFINAITSDSNNVVLLLGNAYYGRNRMTQGVSMSTKDENGEWTKPVNLHLANDYNQSEKANYFMTNDRTAIVMAVQRDDSYGDRDMYVSFSREDGTYTEPLNLGDIVNTADEEGSPFLAEDNQTLFFSSRGFSGYGGFDIYLTRRLDDTWTNWSEPENLGAAFNSLEDDIFFNFTENDEYAYFTRGTEDNTDIYRVKLPYYQRPQMLASLMGDDFLDPNIIVVVKGIVYDSKTLKPIEASLEFFRALDSVEVDLARSDSLSGAYRLEMKEGFVYNFDTKSRGYYPKSDFVDLKGITESVEIVKDVYLDPIVKDKPIVLQNVNFDFDSDVIRKSSYPELNSLAELISDNPDYLLSIEGHTCSMGPDAYNQNLSERRARSVVKYLAAQGVEEVQLTYIGYGELKPTATNETKAGREENRRVEFQIKDREAEPSSLMR